ncbi:MAG: CheY-like chemotaxis protein, partial [Pseudohongiellaceae bacterium]
ALEALRADPKTKHIPVLAVTGNPMPHDLSKISESGFDGVDNKPFRINDLLQAIRRVLPVEG